MVYSKDSVELLITIASQLRDNVEEVPELKAAMIEHGADSYLNLLEILRDVRFVQYLEGEAERYRAACARHAVRIYPKQLDAAASSQQWLRLEMRERER